MMCEFAPADLGEELRVSPRGVLAACVRELPNRMPDFTRTDLAEMQMRRQTGRSSNAGLIAPRPILIEGLLEKTLHMSMCSSTARLPRIAHPGSPIDAW
jgi:hypothetical protein